METGSPLDTLSTLPLGAVVDQQEQQALAQVLRDVESGAVLDVLKESTGVGRGNGKAMLVMLLHKGSQMHLRAPMAHRGVLY